MRGSDTALSRNSSFYATGVKLVRQSAGGVSTPFFNDSSFLKLVLVKPATEIPRPEVLRKLRRRAREVAQESRELRAKLVAMRSGDYEFPGQSTVNAESPAALNQAD